MVGQYKTYQFPPEKRAFLENSKLAFSILQVVDGDYKALLVSEGACKIFGLGHEELMQYLTNKSYRKMHPEDAGKLIDASRRMMEQDELSVVFRIERDGAYHSLLFHSLRNEMPDGTVLFIINYTDLNAVNQDISHWFQDYMNNQKDRMYQDGVTGLPNINFYETFADGTLKEYLEHGRTPSVILFDIAGMHFYNDRLGYEAGDRLLRETGKIISDSFQGDFCVHYTEDHYIVITGRDEAEIRACFANVRRKMNIYTEGAAVDIKAGVYEYRSAETGCVAAADRARRAVDYIHDLSEQYIGWYTEEVSASYRRRNWVMNHFREAIEKGWIKVYYQPLVDSATRKVTHYEALARWIDPKYGFLNPGDFIGILEAKHCLWEVDLHMIELVCRDIRAKMNAGKVYVQSSVNLSRYDLNVPDLHERINDILAKYNIPHGDIAIELTEPALVDHEEMIGDHIRRFHEDGYQVWLDDFGSGYSSFNTLQNFDFDVLKIDLKFLRNANGRTPLILTTIVNLSKQLGMRSVTEGVETMEQADFLTQIKCDLLQGFCFSKPIPGEHLDEELEKLGLVVE